MSLLRALAHEPEGEEELLAPLPDLLRPDRRAEQVLALAVVLQREAEVVPHALEDHAVVVAVTQRKGRQELRSSKKPGISNRVPALFLVRLSK